MKYVYLNKYKKHYIKKILIDFNFFKINYNNKIIASYSNNNTKFLFNFLTKNGNKVTLLKHFLNSLAFFYYKLKFNNSENFYSYYNEFKFNSTSNLNFNNIIYLLNWMIAFNSFTFDIQCLSTPKKYKKKTKLKYSYKITYIPKHKRLKRLYKWFNNLITTTKINKLNDRILKNLFDLFLNYKNNNLYIKKLLIYKKVFKL